MMTVIAGVATSVAVAFVARFVLTGMRDRSRPRTRTGHPGAVEGVAAAERHRRLPRVLSAADLVADLQ